MNSIISNILADKTGGRIFELFGPWHFFYIILAVATITIVLAAIQNKGYDVRKKVVRVFIFIAFGLYMADFFLMPFAYGSIDTEKLPFHGCTSMCLMCFFSYYSKFLEKYRMSFVLLGLLSNITYLIYPAGVMWYAVHPLSYRVVQTMLFHCVMTIYTILMLVIEYKSLDIKKCYRDFAVVGCLAVWALIGSYAYGEVLNGVHTGYNWFFVVRDPIGVIPTDISPYLMPFLNIIVFSAAEMLIHLLIFGIKKAKDSKKAVDNTPLTVIE